MKRNVVLALGALAPLLLVAACGGDGTSLQTTESVVGPAGGTVVSQDGKMELFIPPGALAAPTTITTRAPLQLPASLAVLAAVDFQPDGLTFAIPATLTIRYDPADLPPGRDPNRMVVAISQGGAWVQVPAAQGPGPSEFTAQVSHFSAYGLLFPDYGGHLTDLDWLQVASGAPGSAPVKLTASDASSGALFGNRVAISGNLAVIGAPSADSNAGAAYVFVRNGSTWEEEATLTPSVAQAPAFGGAVAISGGTVIVGAPRMPSDLFGNGTAHVFVRSHTGAIPVWTEQQVLQSPRPWPGPWPGGNSFGAAVSIDGDLACVGEPLDIELAPFFPALAHVFIREGATWSLEATIVSPAGMGDGFGCALAQAGDTLVVGARWDSIEQGAAYVFERDAAGASPNWELQQALADPAGQPEDHFGAAVALEDDTVLVGAPGIEPWRSRTTGRPGTAHVFSRAATIWSIEDSLFASDGIADDRFGAAVAFSGGAVIVGAPAGAEDGVRTGALYRFTRSHADVQPVWLQEAKLIAADGVANDDYGAAVAVSGETMMVGAPRDDVAGSASGSVYAYEAVEWAAVVGNTPSLPGPQGALRIFGLPSQSNADPLGSVVAQEGTAFLGARLVGEHLFLISMAPGGESWLPPITDIRVYDLSDVTAPALVGTGRLPVPEVQAPAEGVPSLDWWIPPILPALDAVSNGPGSFRAYTSVAWPDGTSDLGGFDFEPGGGLSAESVPPTVGLRVDGTVWDVAVLPDGRVAVLLSGLAAPGTGGAVRILDADLQDICCEVAVPGGVAFARAGVSPPPAGTLVVADYEGGALHVLDVSAPDAISLVRTVAGLPAPVSVRHSAQALFVASPTADVLALDPGTFAPIPFDFAPGEPGACHALFATGDSLFGALLSPAGNSLAEAPLNPD